MPLKFKSEKEEQKNPVARVISEKGLFMLNAYGDLEDLAATSSNSIMENFERLKPAEFYTFDGTVRYLGLPIGHETEDLHSVAGKNDVSPSCCDQYPCDVRDCDPGVLATHFFTASTSSAFYDSARGETLSDPPETQLADDDQLGVVESNRKEFERLKQHPEWGSFFNHFSDLELGEIIGKGSQAIVYEAKANEVDVRDGKRKWLNTFVAKVFNLHYFRLTDLQKYWPTGLVAAANAQRTRLMVPYLCWARGAVLLPEPDNRFAFVFPKLNSDLRKRIMTRRGLRREGVPPFSRFEGFCIISDIAAGMAYLHDRGMLHLDLKAANVLDLRNVCEDETCIMMLVGDFESSQGICGTGFWRAPEILKQLQSRRELQSRGLRREPVQFSKQVDVYSFAMTSYEVITGLAPFEGRNPNDTKGIIAGERPKLPAYVYPELRKLICKCWSSDPDERPSFNEIRAELIEIGKIYSKAWKKHIRYKTLHYFYESDYLRSEEKKPGVENLDWEWPIYNEWRSQQTSSIERQLQAKRNEDCTDSQYYAPFEVIYKEGTMPDAMVKLLSAHLILIAKQCMRTQEHYFKVVQPKIGARDMFICLPSFEEANQSIQLDVNASPNKLWHSKHLLRFLNSHFKDTTALVRRVREEKKVRFDMLWAFLHTREKVSYTCPRTGRKLLGIVTSSGYDDDFELFRPRFFATLECRDYNGWKYVTGSEKLSVNQFEGEKFFNSIGICPLSLLSDESRGELEALFLRNGRKFYDIVTRKNAYMQYEGPRIWESEKQKADGRVMVDLLTCASMNPNVKLGNAQPPNKHNSLQHIHSEDREERPSDEELKLAPAVVYGFSFSNKAWGGFDVNGLSDIQFDDEAFDRDLVLSDPDKKAIILSLVEQYVKDSSANDMMMPKIDPISNKGDGCIFLCYGPPGTGKTLTAEAIAEKLHCPLWSVSVFELGVTIDSLEANLVEVLEISSQWRAILLIDEADVYLEKRASNADPNRTAMTAIFLRVLDYYRGVLFLTTNRVASFDDAFCSRISMFLRFHHLQRDQRESMWRTLLSRAKIENPDLTILGDYELNGREIRNCIQIALALARSYEDEFTTNYVFRVAKMSAKMREDLQNAISEGIDERSLKELFTRAERHGGNQHCEWH